MPNLSLSSSCSDFRWEELSLNFFISPLPSKFVKKLPGSSVVKTLCFQCRGAGSILVDELIPHTTRCGQK